MTATPPLTDALLREALHLQRQAYLARPVISLQERLADLAQLERFLRDHAQGLVRAISDDYGHRSRHETLITEITPALNAIRFARRHLRRWMRPQRRHIDRLAFGLASNRVEPQPLGVVGVIVPWNFPVNLSFVPLTFILAAGNRAMVKMSENSRHLAAYLIQHIPGYFPREKLQFFDETGGVGVQFSAMPFDHLLFTGSGQTARAVMGAAAQNLTPVTLELGGRSPAIIDASFDLRTAAERILYVKCLNAGQICTTVDHVWVPRQRLAEFVELAREIVPKRYPSLDSDDYSSVIDARAYQRLLQTLDEVRPHAQVVGLLPGAQQDDARHRLAPQLVIDPPADSRLLTREIFGPILPVLPYDSHDEVIARIRAGARPLAIYPFSQDSAVVRRYIDEVMSGGVSVNDALLHVAQDDLPFGGVGESGMGHYHGREGFETFSKMRPIFTQARWSTLRMMFPPYGPLTDRLLRFLMR